MMGIKSILHGRKSEQGLSLLEVAIALIIIGLILIPLLNIYKLDRIDRMKAKNANNLAQIEKALNRYAQQNKRLPFPGNPTLNVGNTNLGTEVTIPTATACGSISLAGQGLRCVQGGRDTDGINGADDVLIGQVPYKVLNLNEENSLDIYGSKITYAVSRLDTDTTTFSNSNGTIKMINQVGGFLDGSGALKTSATSMAMFALISHGEDRKGVFARDGTLSPCTTPGNDNENCNMAGMNGTFRGLQRPNVNNAAILDTVLSQSYFLGTGATYFDDMIDYRVTTADDYWSAQRDPTTGNENVMKSSTLKVGVGVNYNEKLNKALLQVDGNVKANDTITQNLCDDTAAAGDTVAAPSFVTSSGVNYYTPGVSSASCFKVLNVAAPASDPAALYCGTNTPMTGVSGTGTTPNFRNADEQCDDTPKATVVPAPPAPCSPGLGYIMDHAGHITCG